MHEKYEPQRDLILFARERKTLSPSKLAEMILNRRNEKVSTSAICHWFNRHPETRKQLQKEMVEDAPSVKDVVDSSLFENSTFAETPSVREWILFMKTRRHKGKSLKDEYIKYQQVQGLKWLCRRFSKHPDRLTFRDAQEMFMTLEAEGRDTCRHRRIMKDFLKSKGSPDWEKIGVGKPRGFQKFRDLYVEKPIVLAMLQWIYGRNFQVYVIDKIMYHNGLRINAVLTAKIENFKLGEWSTLKVLEKFREEKTFMLTKEVGNLIRQAIGTRTKGKIFLDLKEDQLAIINREALKQFVPELEPKIEMPNHFFRHMCAQHLLRASNWNSKAVAAIMQCTEQSLNESYGGAPEGQVKEWCMQFLPKLSAPLSA